MWGHTVATVSDLFVIHRAKSDVFTHYESGAVAYISNTSDDNGVVGFVDPRETDTVFNFTAIVVNAFSRTPNSCGARIQTPPFVASGRSGNGLLVLEPKRPMKIGELAHVAAYLNHVHGWRFTWYRQATKTRLQGLSVPDSPAEMEFPVASVLPCRSTNPPPSKRLKFRPVRLDAIFDLVRGDFHVQSHLARGALPLVSCGDEDNGVIAHVDAPDGRRHRNRLTIALNGRPLATKYHPYEFVAKDDVAVAIPRTPLRLTTLLFVQAMLNREKWRYSYYRKCFVDKLRRFVIDLPAGKSGEFDEGAMASVVEANPYWEFLKGRLPSP